MPAMRNRVLSVLALVLIVGGSVTLPNQANAVVSFYSQLDASGVMSSASSTDPRPSINSESLGNLYLLGDPAYVTFTIRDPQADATGMTPGRICIQGVAPYGVLDCRTNGQSYVFTKSDREILSDGLFHTFTKKLSFTGNIYPNGENPVGVGFAGLSSNIGGTQVKSNAAQTLPALMIQRVPNACRNTKCVSNVLFLPGFGGSRLYHPETPTSERQVWEPSYHTDISFLAMNPDGTSQNTIYTKDIIRTLAENNGSFSRIASLFGANLEVYKEFGAHMDSLVASSTFGLKQWRAYPYDWRYDVRDIVNNGTATKMPDGSVKQVYLKDVIIDMASSSPTGRVTLVAHSNGGLLAKAAAMAFGADAPKYIDRIVMVGTPQLGTPSDIGAMLHGDGQSRGLGFISRESDVRTAARTTPGAYGFLPSTGYFSKVSDPVVTFNESGFLTGPYAESYGAEINSAGALANFLEDVANVNPQTGSSADLHVPLTLASTLVKKAAATHAVLDAWVPPWGLVVTTVAGWGQDTVRSIAYRTGSKVVCNTTVTDRNYYSSGCANAPQLDHDLVMTRDGDETVVTASATGGGEENLYFDTESFETDTDKKITHIRLFSSKPIQNVISHLLRSTNPRTEPYISTTKPPDATSPLALRISSHSPVDLLVTDANGKQSGVVKMPGTDFSAVKRDILGSSVQVVGDEQYINVPGTGSYQVVARGYAAAPTTLQVETVDGSDVTEVATFASIPTTANSTASFSVASGTSTSPQVDLTGDGMVDLTVVSSAAGTDPLAYVQYMKKAIGALALLPRQNHEVLGRLESVEKNLTKYPTKTKTSLTLVTRLEENVKRDAARTMRARPRTTPADLLPDQAVIILGMINELKELI